MALLIGTQYFGYRETGEAPEKKFHITRTCRQCDQSVRLSMSNSNSAFVFSMISLTLFTCMSHIYKITLLKWFLNPFFCLPLLNTTNNCSESTKATRDCALLPTWYRCSHFRADTAITCLKIHSHYSCPHLYMVVYSDIIQFTSLWCYLSILGRVMLTVCHWGSLQFKLLWKQEEMEPLNWHQTPPEGVFR